MGVLFETTSNSRRHGTRSFVKRASSLSTMAEKPAQDSILTITTTTTPLAVPETDPQVTKVLWERLLAPSMPPKGRRGVLEMVPENETEATSVSGVSGTEYVSLFKGIDNNNEGSCPPVAATGVSDAGH